MTCQHLTDERQRVDGARVGERRSEALADCTLTWAGHRLVVAGDIDEANADALTDRITAAVDDATGVIDLCGVRFFGAAGIRMLIRVGAHARHTGRSVQVTCSPVVLRTLGYCGLTGIDGLDLAAAPVPGSPDGVPRADSCCRPVQPPARER